MRIPITRGVADPYYEIPILRMVILLMFGTKLPTNNTIFILFFRISIYATHKYATYYILYCQDA